MPDVRESWRTERVNAAVYDAGVEREGVARALGRIMWGTDTRRLFDAIAALGDLPDGTAIIDIPCGGGLAFRGLRPGQSLRYVAADISPYMLERARSRADATGVEGIELTEADIESLPFDDGTFDLCVSFNGLHCLPDQRSALAEVGRVIKPGGELRGTAVVHGEGARHDGIIRLFRRISAFGETTTADQLTTLLGDAGLEDVRVELSGALARFHARKPTSH